MTPTFFFVRFVLFVFKILSCLLSESILYVRLA